MMLFSNLLELFFLLKLRTPKKIASGFTDLVTPANEEPLVQCIEPEIFVFVISSSLSAINFHFSLYVFLPYYKKLKCHVVFVSKVFKNPQKRRKNFKIMMLNDNYFSSLQETWLKKRWFQKGNRIVNSWGPVD